jgi:hypothetical protein
MRQIAGLAASTAQMAEFDTDALAGFVLARASAGLTDATIRGDIGSLERVRSWCCRPLREVEPADADPLHLAVVFGDSDAGAVRYAANARPLLRRPHEAASPDSPGTQVSTGDTEPGRYFGSR